MLVVIDLCNVIVVTKRLRGQRQDYVHKITYIRNSVIRYKMQIFSAVGLEAIVA